MVEINIEMSLYSQKLIREYWGACGIPQSEPFFIDSAVNLETLLSWLNEEQIQSPIKPDKNQKQIEFILVSLHTELLRALYSSMKGEDVKMAKQEKNTAEASKIKFLLLTLAGILVAGCQGFDGIVTMLSIFTIPSLIITLTGFAFSIFSIVFFCGIDLVKVSNSLGVKISDTYRLLDACLLQLENIKAIRKKINDYNLADLSHDDFKKLERILFMLQNRFSSLAKTCKQFDEALNSPIMSLVKALFSGVSALLFFGGGFFAGQSVALFVSSLMLSSAIASFWPVIIFSTIVGLAALSIYWCVERPGVNRLVSSWFGLKEEDVEKLCDNDLLAKEAKKLERLNEKVSSMARLTSRLILLEQEADISDKVKDEETPHPQSIIDGRVSDNFYSFLKPQRVLTPRLLGQHNLDDSTVCSVS